MIISAKVIKKPRTIRICNGCGKKITGSTLRLFGCALRSDPPYAIYFHPDCCVFDDPKIKVAKTPYLTLRKEKSPQETQLVKLGCGYRPVVDSQESDDENPKDLIEMACEWKW